MVSTFHGLETGKRALSVGQASISTTGQNIANANTKGYSRQQVNQSSTPSLDVWTNSGIGQLGSGVSIDSITRVRDRFLDNQYRDQSSTLGEAQTRQAAFDRLETIINEPSDSGLNSAMDQLWNARQDLSINPDSVSAQAVVKERAQAFVEVAQSMDSSLANMKIDLGQQKAAAVTEANDYLKQIALLNESIVRGGNQSNDLKDQRDVLVEKLSTLAPIKVEAQSNGSYTISLEQPDGELAIKLVDGNTVTEDIQNDTAVTGGKIAGLINAENKVQENHDKLVAVATGFASANNETEGGTPLFSNTASIVTMQVDFGATLGAPTAAMETGIKGVKSDYQKLVSTLGTESQSATRSVANFEATLQATENRRQSVTGVSLDEEMANLVKFQHSYSAAARLISATDQMLDTIINRMAAR